MILSVLLVIGLKEYISKLVILLMKKIAIICGGPSSEYEVSLDTARSVYRNIDKKKYEIWLFHIDKEGKATLSNEPIEEIFKRQGERKFLKEVIKLEDFDMCFLATHGEFGEDGTLQTLLEYSDIKYTGSDSYSSRLCMDKYRSSIIVGQKVNDVIIPATFLAKLKGLDSLEYKYPVVLKPNKKGSSVGVHIVKNKKEKMEVIKELKRDFDGKEGFLVQEAIMDALEVSCSCLESKDGEFLDIPAIEIIPQLSNFFDYKSKYTKGGSIEIFPPKSLKKRVSDRLTELAKEIHVVLGCSVYSRSDFLIKDNKIYYLETNTLPGMTSTSLLPQECEVIGMNFSKLIDFIIQNS